MPGIGVPIVIGGGIQLGSPNALNEFLYLTSITPPAASSTPRVRLNGTELIMESVPNRGDTIIGAGTSGASGTTSTDRKDVFIGSNITSTSAASGTTEDIAIGENIGIGNPGGSNVVIGLMTAGIFTTAIFNGTNNTMIGRVASIGAANRNGNSSLGSSTTLAGSECVVIGYLASATGNNSVIIGKSASSAQASNIVIGHSTGAAGVNTIAIGTSASQTGTSANNLILGHGNAIANLSTLILIGNGQVVTGLSAGDICIGHNNYGGGGFSSRVIFGGANTHTSGTAVPAWTTRFKNAAGTDVAAGNATFIAPLATGNAVGGSFVFQTGPAGASGATLQTATTRLTISPNGVATFGTPTTAAENIVIEGFGGAAQPSVRFNNLTSGAGAAVGTLNNAPSAGNPSFWIPVSIAGNVRYIPAWT